MSLVDVGDLRLHVERAGSGRPVVLLHGFTGAAGTWRSLVEVLRPQFTTLAVDLVGHGRSDAPRDLKRYQMRRAVDDLAAVLPALGFERAAWLGYSLGGRTALQVAVHRPEVVSSLILEGATPGIADAGERADRVRADEALADRIEREGVEAFVDYWQALPLWDSQASLSSQALAAQRQQRLANDPVGLANSLRGMGTGAQAPVHERLGEVGVPVMLIAGSLDRKFNAIAGEMARTLPDVTLEAIDGAGHAAHLERPSEFNATVSSFLQRVDPDPGGRLR